MPSTTGLNSLDVSGLVSKIKASNSLVLTTHKQCDGDGLGAVLALYHALQKMGKKARAMCVDAIPRKYRFLQPEKFVEIFAAPHAAIEATDLALVFDTNDKRLVAPLFAELEQKCKNILFVDHHPILSNGPEPTPGSYINTKAASVGEIAYFVIKELGVPLDAAIARALYTSIVFDTQLFRYVRSSPTSHLICAELLQHEKQPEEVHGHLFATHSVNKMTFLATVLHGIEYYADGRVAIIKITGKDLKDNHLQMDDSRDVIDMIMNINSVQVAALFREDEPGGFKMSLRSKGRVQVLEIAEAFDGGGHAFAAGAFIKGDYQHIKSQVTQHLLQRLSQSASISGK